MRLTVCSPQESSGSPQMTQERDTGFRSVQLSRRAADILILSGTLKGSQTPKMLSMDNEKLEDYREALTISQYHSARYG